MTRVETLLNSGVPKDSLEHLEALDELIVHTASSMLDMARNDALA